MSTITFQCYSCQKVLRVGADKAGKKAKCVQCGTILTIPVSSPEEEAIVAELEPAPRPPAVPRRHRDEDDDLDDDRPRRRRDRDDDDDADDRPRKRRRDDDDDLDDEDRPKRRRDRDDDEYDDDRPRKRRRDDDDGDDRPRSRLARDDDDDEDYEEDRKPRRPKGLKQQKQALVAGLTLFWWKWLSWTIVLGLVFGGILLAGLVRTVSMSASDSLIRILSLPIGLTGLAGMVLGIVAASFTLRVPARTGYRGLSIPLLVLECCPAAFIVLVLLIGGPVFVNFRPVGTGLVFSLLYLLSIAAEFIVFMIFLRGLAMYFRDKGAARDAIVAMIYLLSVPCGFTVFAILFARLLARAGFFGAVVFLAAYVTVGVLLVINSLRVMHIILKIKSYL